MLWRRWTSLSSQTERREQATQAAQATLAAASAVQHRTIFRKVRIVAFLLIASLALPPFIPAIVSCTAAANITYVYDSVGQLIAVVDGSGNAATYTYDPVGNLTAITPASSSGLLIFDIDPGS